MMSKLEGFGFHRVIHRDISSFLNSDIQDHSPFGMHWGELPCGVRPNGVLGLLMCAHYETRAKVSVALPS